MSTTVYTKNGRVRNGWTGIPGRSLKNWHHMGGTHRYVAGPIRANSMGTTVGVASGTIVCLPLLFDRDVTISSVGFYITVAASAGGQARVGIYSSGGNYDDLTGLPDLSAAGYSWPTELVASTTDIATDVTGDVTASLSANLTAGRLYWLAVLFSTGCNVRTCLRQDSSPMFGLAGMNDTNFRTSPSRTGVTYGALPDIFPLQLLSYSSSSRDIVFGLVFS